MAVKGYLASSRLVIDQFSLGQSVLPRLDEFIMNELQIVFILIPTDNVLIRPMGKFFRGSGKLYKHRRCVFRVCFEIEAINIMGLGVNS